MEREGEGEKENHFTCFLPGGGRGREKNWLRKGLDSDAVFDEKGGGKPFLPSSDDGRRIKALNVSFSAEKNKEKSPPKTQTSLSGRGRGEILRKEKIHSSFKGGRNQPEERKEGRSTKKEAGLSREDLSFLPGKEKSGH